MFTTSLPHTGPHLPPRTHQHKAGKPSPVLLQRGSTKCWWCQLSVAAPRWLLAWPKEGSPAAKLRDTMLSLLGHPGSGLTSHRVIIPRRSRAQHKENSRGTRSSCPGDSEATGWKMQGRPAAAGREPVPRRAGLAAHSSDPKISAVNSGLCSKGLESRGLNSAPIYKCLMLVRRQKSSQMSVWDHQPFAPSVIQRRWFLYTEPFLRIRYKHQ